MTGPAGMVAGPPLRAGSRFHWCLAQKDAAGVLKPSGCVPGAERITYTTLRFLAQVVWAKWVAEESASSATWCPVADAGAAVRMSAHTPASAPPSG